jgi:type IV pilus assembly protein PilV
MAPATQNNEGFSLIEFLVALVILSVGLLGLLQTVNCSIDHNMTTQLRQEAVRLADERLTVEKSRVFDAISTNVRNENVRVEVMAGFKNYSVAKQTTSITNNTRTVQVDVTWRYKGKSYGHSVSSLVSKSTY